MREHTRASDRGTRAAWRAVALAWITFLLGCGAAPEPPAATGNETEVPADVYVVRGELVRLPEGGDPSAGFHVHHEAIDDFRGADGSVIGMDAMTMRFPLDDPSLLEGLEVGDKVELVWEVRWGADVPQYTRAVRRLPAETELVFREATPPPSSPPASEDPSSPERDPSSGGDSPD